MLYSSMQKFSAAWFLFHTNFGKATEDCGAAAVARCAGFQGFSAAARVNRRWFISTWRK
jgi:hypothetical protein